MKFSHHIIYQNEVRRTLDRYMERWSGQWINNDNRCNVNVRDDGSYVIMLGDTPVSTITAASNHCEVEAALRILQIPLPVASVADADCAPQQSPASYAVEPIGSELEAAFRSYLATCPKHQPPLRAAGRPIFPNTGRIAIFGGYLQWHRVGTSWEGSEIVQLALQKDGLIVETSLINL